MRILCTLVLLLAMLRPADAEAIAVQVPYAAANPAAGDVPMSSAGLIEDEEILASTVSPFGFPCCLERYGAVAPTRLAYAFTVPASRHAQFTGASLLLTHDLGTSNAVEVNLAADSTGHPGAVLESFVVAAPPLQAATAIVPVRVTSALKPLLRAGDTYWLIVAPLSPGSGVGWHSHMISSAPPMRAFQLEPNGPWEVQCSEARSACIRQETPETRWR